MFYDFLKSILAVSCVVFSVLFANPAITTNNTQDTNESAQQLTDSLVVTPGRSSESVIVSYFSHWVEPASTPVDRVVEMSQQFKPLAGSEINFGYSKDVHWLRVEITNLTDRDGNWVFNTGARNRKSFAVYEIEKDEITEIINLNEHARFSERVIPFHHLAVPVELAAHSNSTLLIRMESTLNTRLTPQFFSESDFQSYKLTEYVTFFCFSAVLGTMILVNLVQFFALKRSVHLYYSMMIFLSIIFVSENTGFNFQYFWPDYPGFDQLFLTVNGVALPIVSMKVFRLAIGFKTLLPKADSIIPWSFYAVLLAIACVYINDFEMMIEAFAKASIVAVFFLLAVILYVGIKAKVDSIYFYLLGWVCYYTGYSGFLAINMGFDPGLNLDSLIVLKSGILLEVFFLSFALANQMRLINKRHISTQNEYIRLLENSMSDHGLIQKLEYEKREQEEMTNNYLLRIASVNHDIAQPINAVRLNLARLQSMMENQNVDDKENLQNLENAINYADQLLRQSILDYKETNCVTSRVHVGHVFNQLYCQHRTAADEKGIQLRYVPTLMKIDASELILYRIMDNLLTNALRYTGQGKVVFGVRRRHGGVEFQVHDTGQGISKEEIKRLLEPFARNDYRQQGFGLGLSIVDSFCRQFNYQLKIDSRLKKGSCFAVFVPQTLSEFRC